MTQAKMETVHSLSRDSALLDESEGSACLIKVFKGGLFRS